MSNPLAPSRRAADLARDAAVITAVLLTAVVLAWASVTSPLLMLFGAGGLAVAAVVLRRPDVATLVVLATMYVNAPVVAVNQHGLPFVVGVVVPFALLAPLVFHVVVRRERLRIGVAGPLLLVLATLQLVSALAADDWTTTGPALLNFLTNGLALYLLLVNVLRSPRTIRLAALTVVLSAGLLGLVTALHAGMSDWPGVRFGGFSQLVRGDLLEDVDWGHYFSTEGLPSELRAAGPIGETNFFALVLMLALPYALAFVFAPRARHERVLALLAAPFILGGILLTYSRGALVVIAVVAGLFAVTGLIPRSTLLALGLGGVAVLAIPDMAVRLVRLATAPLLWTGGADQVGDAALVGRFSEMVAAAHAWQDHPFLGLGPGLFPANYPRYAAALGYDVHDGPREAHNLYLQFAAELGTGGMLLLVVLLVVLARAMLRARRQAASPAARAFAVAGLGVIAMLAANGMFLHLAFERYLWLHVAIVAAWAAEQRRTTDTAPDGGALAPAQELPVEVRG
ncbi:O-antigen ligase family protein [Egicoccus halophilus]|uniref:O-antigen ligase-related domain-containing protein n=1 Tax=Egicoccus halophilus TaxID=1670830 RepID=A0A8J3ET19_9ACTN|nr:O-antigen ligase family protein [Egicoccus halophilus]GGI08624.1 hypothetical protein GCM10011354_30010 [Egicoccus halophilus]